MSYATRAMVHFSKKDFGVGVADLELAIALDSKQPLFYLFWAMSCVAWGKPERLDQAVADSPEIAITLNVIRAVVRLSKRGQAVDAGEELSKAIVSDPENGPLFRAYRAMSYILQLDYPAAIADLTAAIDAVDDPASMLSLRGVCFEEMEDFDRALADFDASIKLNSRAAEGYLHRGRFHVHRRQWSEAVSDFDRAVEQDPKSYEALYERALVHFRLKQFDHAISDCAAALKSAEAADPDFIGPVEFKITPTNFSFGLIFNPKVASGSAQKARWLISACVLHSLCYLSQGDEVHALWDIARCLQLAGGAGN